MYIQPYHTSEASVQTLPDRYPLHRIQLPVYSKEAFDAAQADYAMEVLHVAPTAVLFELVLVVVLRSVLTVVQVLEKVVSAKLPRLAPRVNDLQLVLCSKQMTIESGGCRCTS